MGKDLEGGSRLNLKELNEFKEEILGPLKAFKEKAGERGTPVGTVTEALAELQSLEVERKLLDKAEQFRSQGMEKEARGV